MPVIAKECLNGNKVVPRSLSPLMRRLFLIIYIIIRFVLNLTQKALNLYNYGGIEYERVAKNL